MISSVRKRAALNKRVVTLDIDSTAIRVLEASGGTVRKWASVSLEPDTVEGGVVSDQQALKTRVKQLLSSSDIKAGKVIASLSGLYSVSRILTVPEGLGGLTTQQVILEAARETMPIDTEELYLSWQIITAGEGERQALVVGVPREVIDSEVQALKMAGTNPRVLELKAMALTRVVNREQALILNIEPTSFDIIIAVGGMPEIMRTIVAPESALTGEDKAEYLVTTLELTVGFYDSHHPDSPLGPAVPLFITGPMSADSTLMEKLQARLRYPVEPLAPLLECPEHLPIAQYAVNIGLALRETVPPGNLEEGGYVPLDINLLPEIYYPWKPSRRQLYAAVLFIGAIALIFYLFQITTEAMDETADLEARYNIFNNELQRRQLEIANRAPWQEAIKEYGAIVAQGGNFTDDLAVINREASRAGVQVNSVTHDGNSINIDYQADEGDYITFREYLTALEASGRFATPIPPPEGYPFTWRGTITLEPLTGE